MTRSQYQRDSLPNTGSNGEVYPSLLLYGCGCWLIFLLAFFSGWLFL